MLFRQQKDETRSRGYFQKSIVLISEHPFVDLYDRILRVVGPLYFRFGADVLAAVYDNIQEWCGASEICCLQRANPLPFLHHNRPAIVFDTPTTLPLAGSYISCIIPRLLDYDDLDRDFEEEAAAPSPPNAHFITESEDVSDDEDDDDDGHASEETVLVSDGKFVVSKHVHPPSPSFGDMLLSKRSHQSSAFEVRSCSERRLMIFKSDSAAAKTVGLYSSFAGMEQCLWLLWQLAITGESILMLSTDARTCSQATLAFTRFEQECGPKFILC